MSRDNVTNVSSNSIIVGIDSAAIAPHRRAAAADLLWLRPGPAGEPECANTAAQYDGYTAQVQLELERRPGRCGLRVRLAGLPA